MRYGLTLLQIELWRITVLNAASPQYASYRAPVQATEGFYAMYFSVAGHATMEYDYATLV
jgi:hypothetical protein